jgi:hypothetical protein
MDRAELASDVHELTSMPAAEIADHIALEFELRVDSTPGQDEFRATIEVHALPLAVEAVHGDLIEAMRQAADACAVRLGELGYVVSGPDVLGALEGPAEGPFDGPYVPVWN